MIIQSDKEYLAETLSWLDLTEDGTGLTLAGHLGLEEANFSVLTCKNVIHKSIPETLPAANISEGGFSLSWNMGALKMRYNAFRKELGKGDTLGDKPKVGNRSNSW